MDFNEMVKRQVFVWFGSRLNDNVELSGSAWNALEQCFHQSVEIGEQQRAQPFGGFRKWWNNGGDVYCRHAARTFANYINKFDKRNPTDKDILSAYGSAEAELNHLVDAIVERRGRPQAFSPVLCQPTPPPSRTNRRR